MKTRLLLCALMAVVSCRAAVAIGDSYEKVVAEKGAPLGKVEARDMQILRYAGQTVKLKAGRVVAVETNSTSVSAVVVPARVAPAPAPRPAAPEPQEEAPTTEAARWTTDYAIALATAKEQKRHVFLFFTGSDWCGWCKRLNSEILSTPEFRRYAEKKLILVELDFPHRLRQPASLRAQNERLGRQFEIEGYPTVVVLDSSGRPVGRLGYQEGGPGPFLAELKRL